MALAPAFISCRRTAGTSSGRRGSSTGFCPVGNVLKLIGFTPMLGDSGSRYIFRRPTAGNSSAAFISRSASTSPSPRC
jgi:hypothetical protein